MKTVAFLLAAIPALVSADPVPATGALHVAVFDFEPEQGSGSNPGPAISAVVRADIALLVPLVVVNGEQTGPSSGGHVPGFAEPLSREAAADLGHRTGAAALVTGRIVKSVPDIILAAKVIDSETGAAYGAMVHGESSTSLADLISDLSIKIGAIVTRQNDSQAAKTWAPASIHGTQRKEGGGIFSDLETACVYGIDGRPVLNEVRTWSKDLVLRPGRHQISVLSSNGEWVARAVLACDARPAARYEVRSENESERKMKLWIEDLATGLPATRVATEALRHEIQRGIIIDTRMLSGGA